LAEVATQNTSGHLVVSQWCREGEWYVWRERTSKTFGHFRIEAPRTLIRGMSAFFTVHEWRGRVLHVWSLGSNGTVELDGDYVVTRIRFDFWGPGWLPFVKAKVLAEVSTDIIEVAGSSYFGNKDVFIIHGHNEEALTNLTLLLKGLGVNPIVLKNEGASGLTIIEQFELHARECSFAFALMTPDDSFSGAKGETPKWRPRQNVLIEIGWFMARLGRPQMMLLSQGNLEIPSDFGGILYLKFQDNVMELAPQIASRLREAGLI
jgi:predicted nucleotide-binding protein with TIR-like domain